MTVSTVSIPATSVPAGATLVYKGALHKITSVRNHDNDSAWVQFIEPDGHILYRKAAQMVTVRATLRTKRLAAA
jgi:hypothetical protein